MARLPSAGSPKRPRDPGWSRARWVEPGVVGVAMGVACQPPISTVSVVGVVVGVAVWLVGVASTSWFLIG